METIEAKIKGDKYTSDEDLITDFRLMFKNCRSYNEEGSTIYDDANTLEKVSHLMINLMIELKPIMILPQELTQ